MDAVKMRRRAAGEPMGWRACRPRRRELRKRTRSAIRAALLMAVLAACASCGREDAPRRPRSADSSTLAAATQPTRKRLPKYVIPRQLLSDHTEVGGFVIQFLETCYAGDYQGYRDLVGRAFNPESEERFRTIYEAIESVAVDSIEAVDVPDIPPPAYLVISSVSFDPEHKVSLRRPNRKLAILVFEEEGEWRMGPAPPQLQPQEEPEPPSVTSTAPAEPETHYPWDVEGGS
jgi:hypothetical protein